MGGTSFYDIVVQLQDFKDPIAVSMIALPLVSWIGGTLLKKSSKTLAARFLAIPVYLAVVPGVCGFLVIAYLLFFTQTNLLREIDLILVFGPIVCMAFTLIAISNVMSFDEIPGFDRLSGLMLTAGVSFLLVFILHRTRIRLLFFGSITSFLIWFVVLFTLLKVGASKLLGGKD